jgi:uncharacterized protein (TIGR04442 family)
MIQDIRLHGRINDQIEYYATVAGPDVVNRYFHETGETKKGTFVRFFYSGNEFSITPDGISYHSCGGTFCEYMFGVDLPIKDLIKRDVLNRLVMYGAVYSPEGGIAFTDMNYGEESFDRVFMEGNAVSNYYFFIHSDKNITPKLRQEEILRKVGKYLKHTSKTGEGDDAVLIRELFLELKESRSILFLIRLVHLQHHDYQKLFREVYHKNRTIDEDGAAKLKALASLYEMDRYQQERIRIDSMYKHPENKRIVDEYKGVLVGCTHKSEIDATDMAKLARLRTLSIRNRIPLNLFDTLDELLLKGKKIKEVDEPEYMRESRAIFEGLFLKGHAEKHVDSEDLVKLLRAKRQAILNRDNSFEELLLETCRTADERSIGSENMDLLESFGRIVTYFDRFDTTYAMMSRISFMEDALVTEENIRSLLGNKKAFEEVKTGLFRELFFDDMQKNRYLTSYGRKKSNILYHGLSSIEKGDSSVKDVIEELNFIIAEEKSYTAIHLFMKDKIKNFYSDLSDRDSQDQFISEVWKEMLDSRLINAAANEKVFRDAVINIRKEAFYLHNLLPVIIAGSNAKLRTDFLENSGLDRFYVEDLEREYFEKNRLSRTLMERIRT